MCCAVTARSGGERKVEIWRTGMHEYAFDAPAMTTVRVQAPSEDAALAALGEMQMLNWDLRHGNAVITELSLDHSRARLFEVDDESVESSIKGLVQLPDDVRADLRRMVEAIQEAASGDSNDAEIEAGADLADYVENMLGDNGS